MFTLLRTIFVAMIAFAACAGAAVAATTPWQDLGGGKARLLAELDASTGTVSGVIEIALDPGWKTYWRQPGSSGIPPQFDFSGSRDFTAGNVAFPVPEHIMVPESDFVGYHGTVLFPFSGTIGAMSEEGRIHLNFLAGVCKDICIPANAQFNIPFNQLMLSDPQASDAIEQADLLLPGEPEDDFRVDSAVLTEGALDIAVQVPDEAAKAELLVEGPDDWRLVPAVAKSDTGKKRHFFLDLSGVPAGSDITSTSLRFTLAQNGEGIEQWLTPTR